MEYSNSYYGKTIKRAIDDDNEPALAEALRATPTLPVFALFFDPLTTAAEKGRTSMV